MEEKSLGTVLWNGFEVIGSFIVDENTKEKRIKGGNYPLNLDTESRYVQAYEKIKESKEETIFTLLAEVQQNVSDALSELLFEKYCSFSPTTKKNKCSLELGTFLDTKEGLYPKHTEIKISDEEKSISVRDKKTRELLVYETIVENKQEQKIEVYFIQIGQSMLSAKSLHISTTTKSKEEKKEEKEKEEKQKKKLPLAGGHGVGMKQLMAVFATNTWKFEVFGTVPHSPSTIAKWEAFRSPQNNIGVAGSFFSFTSVPFLLPSSFVLEQKQKQGDEEKQNETVQFLCTKLTLPISLFPVSVVWRGLLSSNINFLLVLLKIKTEQANYVLYQNETLAIVKNEMKKLKAGAFYVNGTPSAFTFGEETTLNILGFTENIRDYSREERVASSESGVNRILKTLIFLIESFLKEYTSITKEELVESNNVWIFELIERAYKKDLPFLNMLIRLQSDRIRIAAGTLLFGPMNNKTERLFLDTDIEQFLQGVEREKGIEERKNAEMILKTKLLVGKKIIDSTENPKFYNWLTEGEYGEDNQYFPGYQFSSVSELFDSLSYQNLSIVQLKREEQDKDLFSLLHFINEFKTIDEQKEEKQHSHSSVIERLQKTEFYFISGYDTKTNNVTNAVYAPTSSALRFPKRFSDVLNFPNVGIFTPLYKQQKRDWTFIEGIVKAAFNSYYQENKSLGDLLLSYLRFSALEQDEKKDDVCTNDFMRFVFRENSQQITLPFGEREAQKKTEKQKEKDMTKIWQFLLSRNQKPRKQESSLKKKNESMKNEKTRKWKTNQAFWLMPTNDNQLYNEN